MIANIVSKPARVASIDVFRALTMLCMIFVNDFASLKNLPHWLGHADFHEDFLGFSDVVFPAFLFAIGLSIPFAIENRAAKGKTQLSSFVHILLRTFALLVMGVFMVNAEAGVSKEIGMQRPVFILLMLTGFFLVWNVYPRVKSGWKRYLFIALQILGVALLMYLAFIFRDRSGAIMQKRWWGILGLIGWTYLPCALIYLLARKRLYIHFIFLIAFILLNMAGSNQWLGVFNGYINSNGAHQTLTMAGIIVSLLFVRYASANRLNSVFAILFAAGAGFLLAGTVARNFWIVNKISATPSWIFLCLGISLWLYVFLYWLLETKRKERWFNIIKPAGTATLTCYLAPSIVYSLFQIFSVRFPEAIRTYPLGLLKSLAFALLIIGITALLGKIRIKLKI